MAPHLDKMITGTRLRIVKRIVVDILLTVFACLCIYKFHSCYKKLQSQPVTFNRWSVPMTESMMPQMTIGYKYEQYEEVDVYNYKKIHNFLAYYGEMVYQYMYHNESYANYTEKMFASVDAWEELTEPRFRWVEGNVDVFKAVSWERAVQENRLQTGEINSISMCR